MNVVPKKYLHPLLTTNIALSFLDSLKYIPLHLSFFSNWYRTTPTGPATIGSDAPPLYGKVVLFVEICNKQKSKSVVSC
jgi:hypothetical protein